MKNLNISKALPGIFLVIALIFPIFIHHDYVMHISWMIFLFAAMGVGWNLIGGYAGQLSLGHAAFFAVGAYTSALLYANFHLTPLIGGLAGGIVAMVFALLIGYPCFRLRGPFFTLSTIAFAEIVRILLLHFTGFTGGALGVTIPFTGERPLYLQFYSQVPYYYIALAILAAVLVFAFLFERSKTGYYLAAIREDQDAAESLGVKSYRVKLISLLCSAFIVALCGAFFAFVSGYIDPDGVCSIDFSTEIAVIVIIGGIGKLWGPVLGAALIIFLTEATNAYLGSLKGGAGMLLYGILLVVVVLTKPEGIISFFNIGKSKGGESIDDKHIGNAVTE
ncbi:MAG TPA: branched-chain amino acid ABC transporter permease [Firmicutes bacterium]|jgi:branched-chain amino acid transport system permease protein|nr:branched-chain amino acid ABC transporter permease [Bacillota bacterium]